MKITFITAGLCGLLAFVLAWRVIAVRRSAQVSFGDGGHAQLTARMRAHANFAEYVPLCLILMGLVEYRSGVTTTLSVVAAALIVVRLAHMIGMDRPSPNPFRVVGTSGTFVVLLFLSGWAIWLGV